MQERRLRLGDVLDDYCPREKRLTNHVIVALVGDEVRTTRCTTCDTEHVYKEGKVPARRRKAEPTAALYKTVLENITGRDAETGTPLAAADEPAADVAPPAVLPRPPAPAAVSAAAARESIAAAPAAPEPDAAPAEGAVEPAREEPVHRHQLIRATLPKVEGQVPERKPADFTLWNVQRQPQGRRGRHRQHQAGGGGGNTNWGGYSPYANGHPSGKNPQQQGQGGGGRSRQNQRRGR